MLKRRRKIDEDGKNGRKGREWRKIMRQNGGNGGRMRRKSELVAARASVRKLL